LRKQMVPNVIIIIICLRLSYYNDTERGQNRPVHPTLMAARDWFKDTFRHFQFLFILALFYIEHRIAKQLKFDRLWTMLAHFLTFSHLVYQAVVVYNEFALSRDGPPSTPEEEASKDSRETLASVIGFTIYAAVAICIAITVVNVRFMQGKSWDNVSVRSGLLFAKCCMLLGGKCGPMVYVLYVLQTYAFSELLMKRRDDKPGQSLPL